jgi:hypothetical protein
MFPQDEGGIFEVVVSDLWKVLNRAEAEEAFEKELETTWACLSDPPFMKRKATDLGDDLGGILSPARKRVHKDFNAPAE